MRLPPKTFVTFLCCLASTASSLAQPVSEPPSSAPATQPASQPIADRLQRLNALIAIIEGQNAPEVRQTVTLELLHQEWPQTPARLHAILADSNAPAKTAVANVLSENPQYLDPVYIDPLMAMLANEDQSVRKAAAATLAAYRDNGVTPRLRKLALDRTKPLPTRIAATNALGQMPKREAIDALIQILDEPDLTVASAALFALEQATAMDFGNDPQTARAWWEQSRSLSLEAWQQLQIERLVQKHRETRRRLAAVEDRLNSVLAASFERASDAERISTLTSYLADAAPSIRLLGLRLTQAHLQQGKPLPDNLQSRIRELMTSAGPAQQALAARIVASFREPTDAQRFRTLLENTQHRAVRLAALNGLGYVGDAASAAALVDVLQHADDEIATEAAAALARLAERGILNQTNNRDNIVTALLGAFARTRPQQIALRERLLWAMGTIADTRFIPAFAAGLRPEEAIAVRQAAARGAAALKDPQLADPLAAATRDPDPGIRKTAVDTLTGLNSADTYLDALWERVTADTDEAVRQAAWHAVLTVLARQPADAINQWLTQLPTQRSSDDQRVADLLRRLADTVTESQPPDPARVGIVRAHLAEYLARAGNPAEARAAYIAATTHLHAAESPLAERVGLDLLSFSLQHDNYNQEVATALSPSNPGPDHTALARVVTTQVTSALDNDNPAKAIAILDAVTQHPPGQWPDPIRVRFTQLRQRAAQAAPATPPTTKPAQPATQPSDK